MKLLIDFTRYTPAKCWPLVLLAAVLILGDPFFSFAYYTWNESMGAYPPEADSIAIPIYTEFMGWLILLPFGLAFVAWALCKYPGRISLWTCNQGRRAWGIIWSVVFGLLVLGEMIEIPSDLRLLNVIALVDSVLTILFFIQLRAVIVMKKGWI